MSLTDIDPTTTLSAFSTSIDNLESTLSTILSSSDSLEDWFNSSSSTNENTISAIEKAKARIMLAYTVHDLIWMYLQTSAIDPNTHPVIRELTRIQSYFTKLIRAEPTIFPSTLNSTASTSKIIVGGGDMKNRPGLDLDAASRFINAAISSGNKSKNLNEAEQSGKHIRFDEDDQEEQDGSDDDDVVIVEGEKKEEGSTGEKKDKGKNKRIDPLIGFDDLTSASGKTKKSKKNKTKFADSITEPKTNKKRSSPEVDQPDMESPNSMSQLSKHQKKKLRLKAGGGSAGESATLKKGSDEAEEEPSQKKKKKKNKNAQ